MRQAVLSLLVFVAFTAAGFGQRDVSAEYAPANLPDATMKEVVSRILVWSFRPRDRPTVIYLSGEGIKPAWLPPIRNITFELLSTDEIGQRAQGGLYFFQPAALKINTKTYEIGFGFGDPACESDGTGWHFRVSGKRVRMWLRPGWGSGCGIG